MVHFAIFHSKCQVKFFILTNFFKLFDKHKASLSYKKRRAIGTPLFL
ncbi:hypothetical protein EA1_01792 [Moraxella catarrhalis O35E]|nr:hypothetical protein EA1_01792 [Moraxella catarrhalis O35E]